MTDKIIQQDLAADSIINIESRTHNADVHDADVAAKIQTSINKIWDFINIPFSEKEISLLPINDDAFKLDTYRQCLRTIAGMKKVEGESEIAFFQAMQQMRRLAIKALELTGDGV